MYVAAGIGTYKIGISTGGGGAQPVGLRTAFSEIGSFEDAIFQVYPGANEGIFPHMDDQGDDRRTINNNTYTAEPLIDEDFKITVSSGTVLPLAAGYGRIVANNKIYSAKDGTELGTLANIGDSVAIGCGRIVTAKKSTQSGWIYDLDGNQLGTFSASISQSGQDYGQSIAIGCGRIAVGAPHWDDTSLPVWTYSQYRDNAKDCGQVFLYDLNGNQIDVLRPPDYPQSRFDNSRSDALEGEFGFSVAIKYGRVVIGAPRYRAKQTSHRMGKCFIFDCNGYFMSDIETPSSITSQYRFGESVAFSNYKILVGIPDRYGPSDSDGGVYMYNLTGVQKDQYSRWFFGGVSRTRTGFRVAGNGTMIAISAPLGDPNNDNHTTGFPNYAGQGLVYLRGVAPSQIPRSSTVLGPTSVIGACKASDGAIGDTFGEEIAMSSGVLVVAGGGGSSQPRSDPYGLYTFTDWYDDYPGTVTPAASNKLYVYKLKKTSFDYWDEMLEGWSGYADEFSENF
jgi:hypothetical protein